MALALAVRSATSNTQANRHASKPVTGGKTGRGLEKIVGESLRSKSVARQNGLGRSDGKASSRSLRRIGDRVLLSAGYIVGRV